MKPFFIYKGVNSREMGISILKLPPRIKPEHRGEMITVPGRDGFLFESDDAYNNKTLEIECTFLPPEGKSKEEIDKMCEHYQVGNVTELPKDIVSKYISDRNAKE